MCFPQPVYMSNNVIQGVNWTESCSHILCINFISLVCCGPNIGPILDDRLKENILKPWKGAHSSHSVCVSLCVSVNTLQDTLFGLGTYPFFPYITQVNFWFQATGHSFSLMWYLGWVNLVPYKNWRLLTFFENSFFYGKGGHFSDFLAIF